MNDKKVAIIGPGGMVLSPALRDQIKGLEADKPLPWPEPEPNYVVKSPGMLVNFPGGQSIHMNRETRRKNKVKVVRRRR